jgi:hypothetical protein
LNIFLPPNYIFLQKKQHTTSCILFAIHRAETQLEEVQKMVKVAKMWNRTFLTSFHGILSSSFCTSSAKRVGTHSGTFHCDEALACFMLRLSKHFSGADIVRTRDSNLLESLDAVVDVGGTYDPIRHRYDHHQKDFDQVFGYGFVTKLSSAGLVYKVFLPFSFAHCFRSFIIQYSLIIH